MDFETSGFHHEGGKPIEFAAVLLDEALCEVSQFTIRMRLEEGEEMSQGAFAKHGISKEDLKDEPTRAEALILFQNWLLDNGINPRKSWELQFLGQNVAFDLLFFWDWWGKDYRGMFHYTALDTMIMTEMMNRVMISIDGWAHAPFVKENTNGTVMPSASLEAQAKTFGFSYEGAHGAMFDALLTVECYKAHVGKLRDTITEARELELQRISEEY
jgi:DNA polymerase III epsilon subunit-like protein